jgi:hypothetical protein
MLIYRIYFAHICYIQIKMGGRDRVLNKREAAPILNSCKTYRAKIFIGINGGKD